VTESSGGPLLEAKLDLDDATGGVNVLRPQLRGSRNVVAHDGLKSRERWRQWLDVNLNLHRGIGSYGRADPKRNGSDSNHPSQPATGEYLPHAKTARRLTMHLADNRGTAGACPSYPLGTGYALLSCQEMHTPEQAADEPSHTAEATGLFTSPKDQMLNVLFTLGAAFLTVTLGAVLLVVAIGMALWQRARRSLGGEPVPSERAASASIQTSPQNPAV
jgi:hypothetical protein